MHRYPHDEHGSGWFVGCRGEARQHTDATLRSTTLYELAVTRPVIIGYLALPEHCSIALGAGTPEVTRRDERLSFAPESLLGRMFG